MPFVDPTGYWQGERKLTHQKMTQMSVNDEVLNMQLGMKFHGSALSIVGRTSDATVSVYDATYFLPAATVKTYDRLRWYIDQDAAISAADDSGFQHCFYVRAVGAAAADVTTQVWEIIVQRQAVGGYTIGPDGNWKSPALDLSPFYEYSLWLYWRWEWDQVGGGTSVDCEAYGRPLLYSDAHGEPTSTVVYTETGSWASSCTSFP